MTEAALALSEQKVCSLGEILSTAKEEQAKLAENHAKEFQQHKKVDIWDDLRSQGVYIIKQDIWHHLKQMSLLETSPMLVGKGCEAAPRFGSNQEGRWKKEEGLTDASLLLQNSSDREAKLLQELFTANEKNIQLKNEVKKMFE